MQRSVFRWAGLAALAVVAIVAAATLQATTPADKVVVTKLISDQQGEALATDPNLVNAWGLASSATSPWWVSDQGTSKSTLYTGAGAINPLVVSVGAAPTGVVFANIAGQFQVATDASPTLGNALFIWSGLDGKIHAWRGGSSGLVVASGTAAAYTGLAIAGTGSSARIYAANFRGGTIDVFSGAWTEVTSPGGFVDGDLPDGYFSYGIQTIGSRIFITYAQKGANG